MVALVAALGVCGALLYAKHTEPSSAAKIKPVESNHLQQRNIVCINIYAYVFAFSSIL